MWKALFPFAKAAGEGTWDFLKQGPGHVPTLEERIRMGFGPFGFIGYTPKKAVKRGKKSKTKTKAHTRAKARRIRR